METLVETLRAVFQDVAAASSHPLHGRICLQNESRLTKVEANIRSLFNTFVITTSVGFCGDFMFLISTPCSQTVLRYTVSEGKLVSNGFNL